MEKNCVVLRYYTSEINSMFMDCPIANKFKPNLAGTLLQIDWQTRPMLNQCKRERPECCVEQENLKKEHMSAVTRGLSNLR